MIFRALILLLVFTVAACVVAYIWTGQKNYLTYALKLLKIMVITGLIFFGVMILQRII